MVRATIAALPIVAALVVGPAASAESSTLTVTYDLALSLTSGADTLDLESAQVTFTASFDTNATYIERFGLPAIDALSSSLTITGSGSADGTFPSADPVAFYPLFSGQFYTIAGEPLSYDVKGSTVQLLAPVDQVGGANVGGQLALTHFGTTPFAGALLTVFDGVGNPTATYALDGLEFSSSVSEPVPEPATLSLLGLGLVGVGARRWWQRCAS